MANGLKIQANPHTNHAGVGGFMITAWADEVAEPHAVLSHWITKEEAAELSARLAEEVEVTPPNGSDSGGEK